MFWKNKVYHHSYFGTPSNTVAVSWEIEMYVCILLPTYLHNKRWRRCENNVKVTFVTLSVSEQNK